MDWTDDGLSEPHLHSRGRLRAYGANDESLSTTSQENMTRSFYLSHYVPTYYNWPMMHPWLAIWDNSVLWINYERPKDVKEYCKSCEERAQSTFSVQFTANWYGHHWTTTEDSQWQLICPGNL